MFFFFFFTWHLTPFCTVIFMQVFLTTACRPSRLHGPNVYVLCLLVCLTVPIGVFLICVGFISSASWGTRYSKFNGHAGWEGMFMCSFFCSNLFNAVVLPF